MDKTLLQKGLKRISVFILFAFIGPVVLYEAFKNQTHPFYLPVLITGGVLCIAAIGYGFWGIRTLTDGFLGKRNSK